MHEIKVSIIIPVYNTERYLTKCINSALNQSLHDVEVIAIDDGSTDTSLGILKSYNNPGLKIIRQENQGLSGARNTGIESACGEFLIFLDSDDYIHKDMAREMYTKAISEQSDIVICRYKQVCEKGSVYHASGIKKGLSKGEIFKRVLAGKMSTMACDKMYRRKLFIDHTIKYPLDLFHEDVPITYKLIYYAKKISIIEEALYFWLRRNGSISKSISEKHVTDIFSSLEMTKSFLEKKGEYEKYEKEFIRRVYHFAMGLIDRIFLSDDVAFDRTKLIKTIIKRLEENNYCTPDSLQKLQAYDNSLYTKVNLILASKKIRIDVTNKELIEELEACKKKLMLCELELSAYKKTQKFYKMIGFVLPADSRRRKWARFMVNSLTKKQNNEYKAPIKEKLTETNKLSTEKNDKTIPMLDVAMPISKEECNLLSALKNKFKGQRCFIIGNGPSLNKCDLSLLQNEYTFGVNGIFYKTYEMGFKPTFYMVEDGHVVDDNLERINDYDCKYKFFPSLYKSKIQNTDNTFFFAADLGFYRGDHPSFCKPRFSKNCSNVIYAGQSVTYMNMQLAYYLGFTEVYLIGMDFSYKIRESDETRGATLISNEDDVNHFHPDYFGKGKKWHDPKVERVGLNYEFAKKVYEENGRKIYNATIGGKLEIFERVSFNDLLVKQPGNFPDRQIFE